MNEQLGLALNGPFEAGRCGVRLSCSPVRESVVTTVLTEAIHAQLLWEYLLLHILCKARLDTKSKVIRRA
jgi:hypothetical protein